MIASASAATVKTFTAPNTAIRTTAPSGPIPAIATGNARTPAPTHSVSVSANAIQNGEIRSTRSARSARRQARRSLTPVVAKMLSSGPPVARSKAARVAASSSPSAARSRGMRSAISRSSAPSRWAMAARSAGWSGTSRAHSGA